jgi:NitT/TauT family transport system ATP-binding protein
LWLIMGSSISVSGVCQGNVSIKDLSFEYGSNTIFYHFNLELGRENPVVILGPSGCGKTTLLFLLAGILKSSAGEIVVSAAAGVSPVSNTAASAAAMVFQEPRLLPWMSVLENTALPIQRLLGKKAARERAMHFLELVGLADKANSLPPELSGGQQQRVSLARAFAFPSPVILLDEPFQSLDIPLRIQMMDMVKDLLAREGPLTGDSVSAEDAQASGPQPGGQAAKRLVIAVTHDPREAVYLGSRIIVLGKPRKIPAEAVMAATEAVGASVAQSPWADISALQTPLAGIVFDETLDLSAEDRAYGSSAQGHMERRLLAALA